MTNYYAMNITRKINKRNKMPFWVKVNLYIIAITVNISEFITDLY